MRFIASLFVVVLGACSAKTVPASDASAATPPVTPVTAPPPASTSTPPPAPPAASSVTTGDVATAAPAGGEATVCAADRRVRVDLAATKAAFDRLAWTYPHERPDDAPAPKIADAPDYASLLTPLGLTALAAKLRPAPEASPYDVFSCALTLTPAQLTPGRPADTLVRVDCHNAMEDLPFEGAALTTVRALRPLGDGAYCVLGDLVSDGFLSTRPCLYDAPDDAQTVTLSLVNLLSPDHQTLREDYYGGSCGSGTGRGDEVKVRFHGIIGDRLALLFEATLSEGSYTSPCPPETMETGTLALIGGWPKQLVTTRATECLELGEPGTDDGCDYARDCKPAHATATWTFDGTRYVSDAPATPGAAPAPPAAP